MQYLWTEDDFELPFGATRLGESAPESDKEYIMYHRTTRKAAQSIQAWVPPECGMVKSGLEEDCVWDPFSNMQPCPVPGYSGGGANGNTDTESIMQYLWTEDDFKLPFGVMRVGDSAPESDKEYVMYHGTTWWAAKAIQTIGFCQSEDGMLGRGVYLSRDLEKARHYTIDHPESDKVVIRVRVRVKKVIIINRQGHERQKTWHSFGYDMAWVDPECGMVETGLEEMCVWDPRRIQIIDVIHPQPVLCCSGTGAHYYIDTDSSKQLVEDDFSPPLGVIRMGVSAPESGRKYIMYHGTTREAAEDIKTIGFQQSEDGMLGRGVYLSRDLEKASCYPIGCPESDKVVIRVVVNVGNVIIINRQGHPRQKTWSGSGIDTAWVPPGCEMVEGGLEEMCVWDPRRIRIINVIKPQLVQRCSEGSAHGNI